jgi:hypothetical protein
MDDSESVRPILTEQGEAADALNLPVYIALASGLAGERAVQPLVALLRSDEPIQPAIRDMLADALEGKGPTLRLRLARAKSGPAPDEIPIVSAIKRASRLLKIGEWIERHPDAPSSMEAAIAAARAEFGITRARAFQALAYYREAKALMG